MVTHLDGHSRYVESMGKQDTFSQQTLIPCRELNFGNCERMSQVQRPVHVWVRKVTKPFGKLVANFGTSEASNFLRRWGIGFENVLPFPFILILLF